MQQDKVSKKVNNALLVINSGSSSIKMAVFSVDDFISNCVLRFSVVDIGSDNARFVSDDANIDRFDRKIDASDHLSAMNAIFDWIDSHLTDVTFIAAGHRVVHGGAHFNSPIIIDSENLLKLQDLCKLAPLHQPHNIQGIKALLNRRGDLPQIACFDTAFHQSMPVHEKLFAIPQKYTSAGIQRYGFHGLSYEYIATVLPEYIGKVAEENVIVAHLGHGASLCAMQGRKSIATTMSFSPLDGIPMSTRSGNIDPSAVLFMLQNMKMTGVEIEQLLNHHSGLYGISEISGDVRKLMDIDNPRARLAIDFFVYHIVRAIGSLAAALGGLNALVFTAGIGENSSTIRELVCRGCNWLGVELDKTANAGNNPHISRPDSKVSVLVIPTNEELMIARHTVTLISN